jgi:hypothetical protein
MSLKQVLKRFLNFVFACPINLGPIQIKKKKGIEKIPIPVIFQEKNSFIKH